MVNKTTRKENRQKEEKKRLTPKHKTIMKMAIGTYILKMSPYM